MKAPRVCAYCGQEFPGHAPEGLCPKCLLDLGAAEWEREAVQTPESKVQSPKSEVRTSDSVEESQAAQDKEQKAGVSSQWSVVSSQKTEGRGQKFGNYELLEKIGQGGMGVV